MPETGLSSRSRSRPALLSGTSSLVSIEHDNLIQSVDDVLDGASTAEFVAPGFIDVQVNGFAGVDYNDPGSSHEAIAQSIRTMFSTGVTRFFPTIITGSEERMTGAMHNLRAAKEEMQRAHMPEAHAIEAFHIEGPHISPEDGPRGAHPREHIRPPDIEEFKRWQETAGGNIRLVTVSPEYAETPGYIRELARLGVVSSVGHTKASGVQIQAAVDAGASMSTHLGNAAHATLPKINNYIWDQLAEDRLTASFILDGIHIPGAFFRAALRAKGLERAVLVTDAAMPAMCAPGPYKLGQVDVELRPEGRITLRGGDRLAGSALRMDHAIGNAVRMGGISLPQAIAMTTVHPARAARISGRRRGLTPGEHADLVRFQWDEARETLSIIETVVAGATVYMA
jgi:N-acetylglucosamine-6-phosphate deacetylase